MLDKTEVRQVAKRYTTEVCKNLDPEKVILFGSFVNGVPHQYSDIDIAIVFNNYKGDWRATVTLLQRLMRGIDNDMDTCIEPHMLDETHDPVGFLEHILKTGEILYEKKHDN